jgi:hypothetical protein
MYSPFSNRRTGTCPDDVARKKNCLTSFSVKIDLDAINAKDGCAGQIKAVQEVDAKFGRCQVRGKLTFRH